MTILQQPDALSFSMNLKPFKISTSEEVEFFLMQGGETLLSEMLSPDADGQIELSLRDIIHDRLSCQVPPTADPYVQSSVVADFTAVIGSTSVTFRVIRGGVDRLSGTVNDFLRANFLTWQPNVKPVTYSSPEFLSYYAVDSGCKLKVKAYFTDSAGNVTPGAVKTICSLAQGVVTTVSVQYAVIAGLYSDSLPAYYDVWVASGSTALTYTQRYYASTMQSEEEQWMFFENSLGGIDTFRTFGAVTLDAEHTHHIAEIDDVSYEYRVDTERKWTVNTGHLDISERRWLLDFFPSAGKYVYAGSAVRRIVLTDDSVSYRFRELPSSYSFTFRFAETLPLLNLPRHELPVEMLDITVPDIGSFTLPPRLLEFSRLPLSEGVLFPVQSPYAEEWQVVTMGGITQYLRSVLDIPSPGLGRTDIIRLLSAQLTPLDPLHPEESRIDPSWLPEGYGIIDIEHVTGLREELDSKLDTRFFSNVFTVYDGSGNAIVPNTYEQVADNLKIMVGAWTDQYLSALGLNSQGGGGETGGVSGIRVSSSSVLTPDDEGVVNMAGYIIQPAEKTRWDAAAAMRHAHSNKSILDSITSQQISSWNALTAVRILPGDGLAGGGDLSADVTLSVKLASNSGLSVSSGGLKLDAVNALNSTLTYKALSAAQGKALNDRLAILEAMFTREGSGTSADPYVIRANYGLYTDSFLSALGLNSQGGGGSTFDEDQMWAALRSNTGTYANEKINANHIPDMAGIYGYLKTLYTLSIYGGTTKVLDFKPDVNASIYIKAGGDISLANDTTNRYITLSYSHPTDGANTTISAANGRVLSAITVNSLGHVTSVSSKTLAAADIPSLAWDKITSGKPTTLGGYGITDAKIASGVITLGGNTITPVTSVSMTVPTGFSVSGSPISKTGTLALSYTSGYEGFTTDLKNKINLLYSLFTREGSGTSADPYVIRANYGLYTDSFLSALGLNSQGGGGSTFDEEQMWAALRSNTGTYADEKIDENHIPDIASKYGYATQTWVTNNFNKYTLPLAASGTRGGVQIGYTTSGKNYAVQLSGEKMYVNVPWTDTTYTIATGDANGQIKVTPSSGSAYNVSVKGLAALAYKASLTTTDIPDLSGTYLPLSGGTITSAGNTPLVIKSTNNDNYSSINFVSKNHNRVLGIKNDGSLFVTNLDSWAYEYILLDSNNYSTYTVKKDGTGASGTWGIGISGNAATATKLATAITIWGRPFDGSANVSGDMSSVGNISFSASGKNIGGLLYFDTTNSRIGVGTSSPSVKFHIEGQLRTNGLDTSTDGQGTYIEGRDTKGLRIQVNGTGGYASIKLKDKKVGINLIYDDPTYNLHVNGTFGASGNSSVGGTFGVTGATTLTGLLTANGNIITGTSDGAYIQIGAIKLIYDSTNNALKVIKSDNTSANLYATGAVSALGANSGGGGSTFDEEQMWQALDATNEVINTSHIPDMAGIYGYLKQSSLSGYATQSWVNTQLGNYLPLSGGTMSGNITMGGNAIVFHNSTSANWNTSIDTGIQILNALGSTSTNAYTNYSVGLQAAGYYRFQIAYNADGGTLGYRGGNRSTWYNWTTLLDSYNYTSYTYSATASRTANTVLAAPNGSAGAATFRSLVAADIPALEYAPKYYYDVPSLKGVRITFSNSGGGFVCMRRGNKDAQLVLFGNGYGGGGTIRNNWYQLSPPNTMFTWSIPNSDSIAMSVEVYNGSGDGSSQVYVITFGGSVTFTAIDALTTTASTVRVAYLTDNVASATKLQNARTLWGQSFDGSANISGDMSSVGNISFSASGKNIGGLLYFDTTNTVVKAKSDFHFNPYNGIYWEYADGTQGNAPTIIRVSGAYTDETKGDLTFSAGKWTSSTTLTSFKFSVNGSDAALVIKNNGNIGIGTTSPSHKLHVEGMLGVRTAGAGTLRIISANYKNYIQSGNSAFDDNAELVIGGYAGREGSTVNIEFATTKVKKALTVGTTLGVTGATTLSSTLSVSGNTTIGGTLGVTGAMTIGGNINMSNNNSIYSLDSGNTNRELFGLTSNNNLSIGSGVVGAGGGTYIFGNSFVVRIGDTSSTGNALAINSSKDATLAGTLRVNGNKIYFGDTSHYVELNSTGFHFSHGVYSDSFMSALGANSGGGSGDFSEEQMWAALKGNTGTYANEKINANHIPDTSSLYGYLKASSLSGYVNAVSTTGSGNAVTSVTKSGNTITFTKGSTFLTSHQTLYTLSVYGGTTKVLDYKPNANASLYIKAGGDISLTNDTTNKYITLSYTHPTNGANTTISAANGKVLSAITVNSLGHVTSVSSKTLAAADIPDLSSTYATASRATTLEGYFTSGSAKTALALKNSRTLWGQSFDGTANVSGALTGVTSITASGNISVGGTATIGSHVYMGYGKILYMQNSESTNQEILAINTNDNLRIGYGIRSGTNTLLIYSGSGGILFRTAGTNTATASIDDAGNFIAAGEVTASSDARKKNIISDTKFNVRDIASARSVLYEWNDGRDKYKKVHGGSIAQDWLGKADSFLSQDSDGWYSINYGALALCSAITIAKEVVKHEDRITMLEKENAKLKARIAELEERRAA